jgi:hypothetical protein
VRHTISIDAGDIGWQAAPSGTGRRHACGVPYVCGGSSGSGRHAPTNVPMSML